MAEILSKKEELRNFNSEDFKRLAKNKEGYLYPDTYFFPAEYKIGADGKHYGRKFYKKNLSDSRRFRKI